jgi:lysophospholipase L1-like esterase
MDVPLAAKAILLPVLVFLPGIVAGRRFGAKTGLSILAPALLILGVSGLLAPFHGPAVMDAWLGALLLSLLAAAALAPEPWLELPRRISDVPGGEILAILVFSIAVPFGTLEWAARFATDLGFVQHYQPMKTWRRHGVEDWRRFHVTADSMREQDPVLFWRPKPGGPFSSQRFKSPLAEVPKPEDVFRIIAYGDSNTEGPRGASWSGALQKIFDEQPSSRRRIEVLNAGVAGYSSYQGIQRFLQESEEFEPDLILVSFGWNDVPEAVDLPDSSYRPTSKQMVDLLHFLFRYRLYLVIENLAVSQRVAGGAKGEQPRVSIDEYLGNMQSFEEEAHRVGAEAVFLTRPHRLPEPDLVESPNWRSGVPLYNEALREYAQRNGRHLVDVQSYFEKKGQAMFGDETHFTREGRDEMARLLVDFLHENRLLPE